MGWQGTYLAVVVHPMEGEIIYPDEFPAVGDLTPASVDDVHHLVCHQELQVLPPSQHQRAQEQPREASTPT